MAPELPTSYAQCGHAATVSRALLGYLDQHRGHESSGGLVKMEAGLPLMLRLAEQISVVGHPDAHSAAGQALCEVTVPSLACALDESICPRAKKVGPGCRTDSMH
jgi:hypothetical protein